MTSPRDLAWPELHLSDWEPTYLTLHRWTQIVGKIQLARAPELNHWWHVPLHVNESGLTTTALPCGSELVRLAFDLRAHRLTAEVSDGRADGFPLERMTVADFYDRTMALMRRLGAATEIWPVPIEVADRTPFREDRQHASYDRDSVQRLHRILMTVDRIFRVHRGRFSGKSSPVHFFWGAFDLAVTRFSGRLNPTPPADPVMHAAYSHEVISHGFWPGGDWPGVGRIDEAIFYAYAVPEPPGFRDATLPSGAGHFDAALAEFVLPYEDVRTAPDPEQRLLSFMEETYLAGAQRAGWDVVGLRHADQAPEAPRLP